MLASPAAPQQLWSVFTAKAELVGAAVLRATSQAAVLTALHEAGVTHFARTASVAERFPHVVGEPVKRPHEVPPEVIALGRTAIAETGSVLLDEFDADRAACFLAERLWLLVPSQDIVATLDEGLRSIQHLIQHGSHHPQFVTGPSRTADIERVLTIGVHGPRALMILVIDEPA